VGWDEKNIKYSADRCEKLKKWEYGFCFVGSLLRTHVLKKMIGRREAVDC